MSDAKRPRRTGKTILGIIAVVALVVLIAARSAVVVVPAGARGVLFDRVRGGVQQDVVLGEGLSLINPLTTDVILIDVRQQVYTMSDTTTEGQVQGADGVQAKSNDGQMVRCEVSVRYQLDPAKVAALYSSKGEGWMQSVLLPAVRSITQNVIGDFAVARVYSADREEIVKQAQTLLSGEMATHGIVIHEYLLRNVTFSPEYTQAIENKQIEQQNAQRKGYELQVAEKEAERQRILAEGEARSNEIRGEALRVNSQVIQYEYVRKVAPNITAVIGSEQSLRRGRIPVPTP